MIQTIRYSNFDKYFGRLKPVIFGKEDNNHAFLELENNSFLNPNVCRYLVRLSDLLFGATAMIFITHSCDRQFFFSSTFRRKKVSYCRHSCVSVWIG